MRRSHFMVDPDAKILHARACRWLSQLFSGPRPCHQPGPIGKVPGLRFSARLSEIEGYGEPPAELPSVLTSLYLVQVEVDIEQDSLYVCFFVP